MWKASTRDRTILGGVFALVPAIFGVSGKVVSLESKPSFLQRRPMCKGLCPRASPVQGCFTCKKRPPPSPLGIAIPKDPTLGLCLGTFGDPKEGRRFRMTEIPLYFQDCREARD